MSKRRNKSRAWPSPASSIIPPRLGQGDRGPRHAVMPKTLLAFGASQPHSGQRLGMCPSRWPTAGDVSIPLAKRWRCVHPVGSISLSALANLGQALVQHELGFPCSNQSQSSTLCSVSGLQENHPETSEFCKKSWHASLPPSSRASLQRTNNRGGCNEAPLWRTNSRGFAMEHHLGDQITGGLQWSIPP